MSKGKGEEVVFEPDKVYAYTDITVLMKEGKGGKVYALDDFPMDLDSRFGRLLSFLDLPLKEAGKFKDIETACETFEAMYRVMEPL